jgi:hypothetical protein
MMTLPNFRNPNPSLQELLVEEQRLHSQADKMLEQTGLLNMLAKYGEVLPISGSYAYRLMVYPDIDLGVLLKKVTKNSFSEIVKEMVASKWVRRVSTADTVNYESIHSGRPKGYWLGLDIPFEGDRWGIDCWVQQNDWAPTTPDPYVGSLQRLDPKKKEAILSIKYELIRRDMYGKKYFSNDVYDAVLNDNILSIEAFLESKSEKLS